MSCCCEEEEEDKFTSVYMRSVYPKMSVITQEHCTACQIKLGT